MTDIRSIRFPWRRSADQAAAKPVHRPVVVVGVGPVGLVACSIRPARATYPLARAAKA